MIGKTSIQPEKSFLFVGVKGPKFNTQTCYTINPKSSIKVLIEKMENHLPVPKKEAINYKGDKNIP
jgi:hypothetical protein